MIRILNIEHIFTKDLYNATRKAYDLGKLYELKQIKLETLATKSLVIGLSLNSKRQQSCAKSGREN